MKFLFKKIKGLSQNLSSANRSETLSFGNLQEFPRFRCRWIDGRVKILSVTTRKRSSLSSFKNVVVPTFLCNPISLPTGREIGFGTGSKFHTKRRTQFVVLLSALFLNATGCYQKNTDADFYTFEDANSKLITAYESKDVTCNTSRRITAFVPGRARKKDIDLCVNAVLAVSCQSWASTSVDSTPSTCKTIEFRY